MSAVKKVLKEREAYARGLAAPAPAVVPSALLRPAIPSAAVAGVGGTQPTTEAAKTALKAVAGLQASVQGITATGAGNVIKFLFYASLVAFVVFLLLTFVHFTIQPIFQLSPTDNALFGSLATNDRQSAWTSAASPDTKAEFKSPKSCDITLSMDVYTTGDYSSVVAPKVFLYRSTATGTVPANATVSDLLTALPSTNLIAYLDNETGDLVVSAVTTKDSVKGLESSPPISNLPVKTPFRLTLVLTSKFFEVYIDGKLRATVTLKNTLVTNVEPFWSQPVRMNRSVRVGKLNYWTRTLTSNEIRGLEPVVSSNFFNQSTS